MATTAGATIDNDEDLNKEKNLDLDMPAHYHHRCSAMWLRSRLRA